jgi:hypothetical protein
MRIRQGLGVTYALTGWEAASLLLLRTLCLLALAALIDVALPTSCYAPGGLSWWWRRLLQQLDDEERVFFRWNHEFH